MIGRSDNASKVVNREPFVTKPVVNSFLSSAEGFMEENRQDPFRIIPFPFVNWYGINLILVTKF